MCLFVCLFVYLSHFMNGHHGLWTVLDCQSGLGGCTGHMVCWGQGVIEVKVIFAVAKQLKQLQRKPSKDLVASQL